MRRSACLLLGICLPWVSLEAATVYRSTDAQGNVVFSDRPSNDSERISLEPLTVVPSLETAPPSSKPLTHSIDSSRARDQENRPGAPFMPYSIFEIAAPSDEQTLPTGYAGDVEVELQIEPALRKDHRVRLLLDGEISQSAMHAEAFMLTNLNRGEHTLQAELLDASGQVRHRSAPVTLYVQRASVNLPANPNNPAGKSRSDTGN